MMIHSRAFRAPRALLLLALMSGCGDSLPTAVGTERFPAQARLTSFVLELSTPEFLQPLGLFDGYSSIADLPYLIAANQLDGSLNARILVRTTGWPETIQGQSDFTYVRGRLVMPIDSLGSTADGVPLLGLYRLTQPWDQNSATWTMAVDTVGESVPWAQPGGALGALLSSTTWVPATEEQDSLSWQVDSLTIAQMSDPEFPGVAVVVSGVPALIQSQGFVLRTEVRLASRPDTLFEHSLSGGEGAFIFDPPGPPPAAPGWLVGGLTSGRAMFRVTLPDSVPSCPSGTGACPLVPISQVNLNEVSLLLNALPVTGGFGAVSPVTLRIRIVGSPELGRLAPLGQVTLATPGAFTQVSTRPSLFRSPPTDTIVTLRLTEEAVQRVRAANQGVALPLALLAEPEGGYFGYTRFGDQPRLRIVYTLPEPQTAP